MAAKRKVLFRPVSSEDAAYIAQHLRQADRDELAAAHGEGCNLAAILERAVRVSSFTCTATSEAGVPFALLGLATFSMLTGTGCPWLLGTDKSPDFAAAFLMDGRRIVAEMLEIYPHLQNYVDVRNTTSIRWLKRLGFEMHPPVPYGVQQLPFHPFTLNRVRLPD